MSKTYGNIKLDVFCYRGRYWLLFHTLKWLENQMSACRFQANCVVMFYVIEFFHLDG